MSDSEFKKLYNYYTFIAEGNVKKEFKDKEVRFIVDGIFGLAKAFQNKSSDRYKTAKAHNLLEMLRNVDNRLQNTGKVEVIRESRSNNRRIRERKRHHI